MAMAMVMAMVMAKQISRWLCAAALSMGSDHGLKPSPTFS